MSVKGRYSPPISLSVLFTSSSTIHDNRATSLGKRRILAHLNIVSRIFNVIGWEDEIPHRLNVKIFYL